MLRMIGHYTRRYVKKFFFLFLTKQQEEKFKFIRGKNRTIITGRNNKVCYSQACLTNVSIEIHGDDNEVDFGAEAVVKNIKIRMVGAKHTLHIGELCKIHGGEFVFSHEKGTIEVGKGTFINSTKIVPTFIVRNPLPIHLGERCMLAWDIEIYSGDFHHIYDSEANRRLNPAKEINIGNHVWIGSHVQILKGVSIGENSVIGASSVVTKNLPANCIVAGNPARIIRGNICWKE